MESSLTTDNLRVGIVGATGLVGVVLRSLLEVRTFPVAQLRCFGNRSAGSVLSWRGHDVTIQAAADADPRGLDLVFFSAGAAISRSLAPRFAAAGAIVIDNSPAFRMDKDVPLVVAEVNAAALAQARRGIIANPNCSTMAVMPVLKPLHDIAGLRRMTACTMQAVSGGGRVGVNDLSIGLRATSGLAAELVYRSSVQVPGSVAFARPIAHNVIPMIGDLADDDSGETSEERKLCFESRKILEIPDLQVCATCVRVPVFTGHSLALHAEFTRPIAPDEAVTALARSPAVRLADIPTPLAAAGLDPSYVGRVRRDPTVPGGRGLALFVSCDNLRKGAALNAVQIAELLASGQHLPGRLPQTMEGTSRTSSAAALTDT